MTNDLDDQTVYFNDKTEIRVGPVLGVKFDEFDELKPIPGNDAVDWIYEQFYVRGEDPWTFHLRGGGKGLNILDFIDEYIKTTLKKKAEDFASERQRINAK